MMVIIYPILQRAMENLREKLPNNDGRWTRRVMHRLRFVRELGNYYTVEGRRELGDRHPVYYVWFERGQWRCTCRESLLGRICTHIGAVMLYREYKRLLEKAERHVVYVAEAEVECPGRIEANGEVYVRPAGDGRYRVFVISHLRDIKIRCSSYVIYETEGEKTTYAAALAAVQNFQKGQTLRSGSE